MLGLKGGRSGVAIDKGRGHATRYLFAKSPEVDAVHAGLECGSVSGIYPDMDMISIGPTLA